MSFDALNLEGPPIDRFDGPFRFLSNFYPCTVEFVGYTYPTTEHGFVAAKTSMKRRVKRCR